MAHLVLLGDSIFDNARYVPDAPSVVDHLRRGLPAGWKASLLAVDGSVTAQVPGQLARLPADASHLVVSVGGNDALRYSGMIAREPVSSFPDALTRLADIAETFQREYRRMLGSVLALDLPTFACTVYDAIPGLERSDQAGLRLFNEIILREAFAAGLTVIDLRLICTEAADYSILSPIEPSGRGGGKIAGAVVRALADPDGPGTTRRVVV
ncbi:SGNH/GDSL hydrolase family protein [Paludisphaera soli]|uniref:SGNH/GDSL hydrolase family protein n=1 Tax=Paludisphaera soli TaxID=2712865 RepID=UPI0013EDA13F|nr:SGNH/GDSL hydrolase family protein [Paludisphaera soli]